MKNKKLFVSNFLIKQIPPVVAVNTLEDGVLQLVIDPDVDVSARSGTATPTGTETTETTGTSTAMNVNPVKLPQELRSRLPAQPTSDSDSDGPNSDSDWDAVLDTDDIPGHGDPIISDYGNLVQINPPFADPAVMALVKLKKKPAKTKSKRTK
jgi:hypothetical protein